MKQQTAQEILKKVKSDYDSISEEFNNTRQTSWKEFEAFLPYIKDGQKIIDLGCGNGRFHRFIKDKRQVDYIGIDNNEKLLQKAKTQHQAKFIQGDLLKIPTKDADVILAIASFHHIPSKELRQKSLQEIGNSLKKDGTLIITSWNLFQAKYKKYIWKARLNWLLSWGRYDAHDTFIPWAKTGIKRYYHAFTEKELEKLLKKANFEIIKKEIGRNLTYICRKKS